MALESWEWFVRLMEKGSFTHAAEELQLPQQTLSARLAALERELKCKLVVRSTPLTLTRAGEAFPVSYTHLDVYKRQAMRRTSWVRSAWCSWAPANRRRA